MDTTDTSLTAAQAESLTAESEPWLSCDACFDRIDICVDALLGENGHELDEPMRVHLTRCPACCEEAESLACLTAADHALDAVQALDVFRTRIGLAVHAGRKRKPAVMRLFRRIREGGRGA